MFSLASTCRRVAVTLVSGILISGYALAHSLTLREIGAPAKRDSSEERPDQLPHSRLVQGKQDIKKAWLAGPTNRYKHGVLGDDLEASRLVVELSGGDTVGFELPLSRVFEDLQPRLRDLDGDNNDEILVVESDVDLGAALAIYSVVNRRIIRRTMTPFLGQPYRWLNPVGAGDFDFDGQLDLAIIVTPHIGGILRLYHFTEPTLSQFDQISGVSTHQIGSTELGLGQVVTFRQRGDGLLLPNQSRRALILYQWSPNGVDELTRVNLPAPISSSLVPVDVNRWWFNLEDGRYMEIRVH